MYPLYLGGLCQLKLRHIAKLLKIYELRAILPSEFIYKEWKEKKDVRFKYEKAQIGAVKNL